MTDDTTYSPDWGAAICALLETNGNLRETCRTLGLAPTSVQQWAEESPEFASRCVRARRTFYDREIAVIKARWSPTDGLPLPRDQKRQRKHDRLRLDTLKWLREKLT